MISDGSPKEDVLDTPKSGNLPFFDRKPAKLALEDGTVFHGFAFGATGTCDGEVVFNTSMTGYQEILTDPSYRGQIITMTYPEMGNYGINEEDVESRCPHLSGFIVRNVSRVASNFRSSSSLHPRRLQHLADATDRGSRFPTFGATCPPLLSTSLSSIRSFASHHEPLPCFRASN